MKINAQQLSEIKTKEIDILKEFDRVCNELGISYWAHGGTMLGAVRHKGFIPWDDDIDVKMWYEDFQKLEKEWAKYASPLYFLQSPRTDPHYLQPYGKIRLIGTSFVEQTGVGKYYKQGIFIDLFPMFHFSNKKIAQKEFILDYRRFSKSASRGYAVKRKNILKNVTKWIIGGFRSPEQANAALFRMYDRYAKNHRQGLRFYLPNWNMSFSEAGLLSTERVPFENFSIPIQSNYDDELSGWFGDYMKLPPPEERVSNHYLVELSFDHDYDPSKSS